MKTKFKILTICSSVALIGAIGISTLYLSGFFNANEVLIAKGDNDYSITFSSERNRLTNESSGTEVESTVKSLLYNTKIKFANCYTSTEDNAWNVFGVGGYFYNKDAIHGMKSISFNIKSGQAELAFGWSSGSYDIDSLTVHSYDTYYDFEGDTPNYLKISQEGTDPLVIGSLSIIFSCKESTNPYIATSGLTYDVEPYSGTCIIDGYNGTDAIVNIPERHFAYGTIYPVQAIKYNSFNNDNITTINIPKSIIAMEVDPFGNNPKLTAFNVSSDNPHYSSIDGILYDKAGYKLIRYPNNYSGSTFSIGSSVTSIDQNAFQYCKNLTSISIPNNVNSIGAYAFSDCSNLTSATLNNKISTIPGNMFANCSALTSVNIPDSVTYIENGAFKNCTSLKNINLNKISKLGDSAFSGCTSLESIDLSNITGLNGSYIFERCASLTSVSFPGIIDTIPNYTFYKCSKLASVTIGNSVKTIGHGAFSSCTALNNVIIPSSVTKLNSNAFEYCTSLSNITLSEGLETISLFSFNECDALVSIVIPESVTTIGLYIFEACNNLTAIYCKATSNNSGWEDGWNRKNNSTVVPYYLYSETSKTNCWHYNASNVPVLW